MCISITSIIIILFARSSLAVYSYLRDANICPHVTREQILEMCRLVRVNTSLVEECASVVFSLHQHYDDKVEVSCKSPVCRRSRGDSSMIQEPPSSPPPPPTHQCDRVHLTHGYCLHALTLFAFPPRFYERNIQKDIVFQR